MLAHISIAQTDAIIHPYYISPRTGEQHMDVRNNWDLGYAETAVNTLKSIDTINSWITVAEPTNIQVASTESGKLPHQCFNMNAKLHEWVDKKVWYYKKKFRLTS